MLIHLSNVYREAVDVWLSKVHVAIANLKRLFHGVSDTQLQECLDEFVYRDSRCF